MVVVKSTSFCEQHIIWWICKSIIKLNDAVFVLDTKNLQDRETWSIDTDDERGGTTTLVNSVLVLMLTTV